MIQELFGGSNVGILGGERAKISNPGLILEGNPNSQSSPAAAAAASSPSAAAAAPPENLRCPRCDSSNTKFCYYNNYNLTQPRHFCKTCRRYWTKGGALRNVPIGGGCRKNKSTAIAAAVGKSGSSVGKLKSSVTNEIGKSAAALFGGFDHGGETAPLTSNPIIWAASSQNSHFLSLLRSNPTPNPNPNSIYLQKDEAHLFGPSNWMLESPISGGRLVNIDPVSHHQANTAGLSNSVYKNQTQAILPGDGFQELYQRLRSSTGCYPDHTSLISGNMGSANSAILESAPIATGDQLGFFNSTISWPSDMPTTTNGAYP